MTDFANQIIQGDSLDVLPKLPEKSVDVVFADPPYNLTLRGDLWRPNQTRVDAVTDDWDQFSSFQEYDHFTHQWLSAVRRVMKSKSSIWISGTYHNIFRVGAILQDLGFWVLNTVSWKRPNAMPNFNGTRLKNDVEYIIWAKKSEGSRYHINYRLLKRFNEGKQLGSVWEIPICSGAERLTDANGEKLHSTQKPEELLRRILLASGKPGDLVLDPFSGTGTTAAVAKELHMGYIGIERAERYIQPSRERIAAKQPLPEEDPLFREFARGKPPRVAFQRLIECGYLRVGQPLYLHATSHSAEILPDGKLRVNGNTGSIHGLARQLKNVRTSNGWREWLYESDDGSRQPIDALRQRYREDHL